MVADSGFNVGSIAIMCLHRYFDEVGRRQPALFCDNERVQVRRYGHRDRSWNARLGRSGEGLGWWESLGRGDVE